jgi:tetratricopeptide (TPR) repeat protein
VFYHTDTQIPLVLFGIGRYNPRDLQMADPRRLESVPPAELAERESQVDALLIEGLDKYFNGRYEEAIHLWTRVLFLDRSHARARAYIDRARTAVAERQRRAEEMLHASHLLLEQGRTEAARELLVEAVAQTGDDDHAAALRVRLERVERLHAASRIGPMPSATTAEAVPGWMWPRRSRTALGAAAVLVAGLLLVIGVTSTDVQDWVGLRSDREQLLATTTALKLTVLSSAEVAMIRAQTLYNRGRLAEALQVLDRVGPESPERPAADELRVQIQQILLASSRDLSGAGRGAEPRRR